MLQKYCGATQKNNAGRHGDGDFLERFEGEPKGVILSHFNIASNVATVDASVHAPQGGPDSGNSAVLSSFGFTGTLCLPAASGIARCFIRSPLDSRAIGALVSQHSVRCYWRRPPFLNAYTRRLHARRFGSLRIVMAGAEKLPDRISIAFEDQFGISATVRIRLHGVFSGGGR